MVKNFATALYASLAALGVTGIILYFAIVAIFAIGGIVCGITGIIVTFSVSILIGIIFLIIPIPMLSITGLLWFVGVNVPMKIQEFLNLPF